MKQVIYKDYKDFLKSSLAKEKSDGINAVDFANAMIQESHRWIPVSERLPEEKDANTCGGVFVLKNDGSIAVVKYSHIRFHLDTYRFWQPLPPLPGKEGLGQ